ncbi:uncharacterized protein LOC131419993 isoform X2 [Diceros bicornis minor]|uniref:uncharacterized protein LOC131419993 isoform X2 n=1 Tax=Diceros bicornis minor TaxID=77932 RepID=UPI0026F23933|nr:uncharacterized protein LOC131419993 isoform X2 [Diceros bicornis minor]
MILLVPFQGLEGPMPIGRMIPNWGAEILGGELGDVRQVKSQDPRLLSVLSAEPQFSTFPGATESEHPSGPSVIQGRDCGVHQEEWQQVGPVQRCDEAGELQPPRLCVCMWATTTAWTLTSGAGLHPGTELGLPKWSVLNLTTMSRDSPAWNTPASLLCRVVSSPFTSYPMSAPEGHLRKTLSSLKPWKQDPEA